MKCLAKDSTSTLVVDTDSRATEISMGEAEDFKVCFSKENNESVQSDDTAVTNSRKRCKILSNGMTAVISKLCHEISTY